MSEKTLHEETLLESRAKWRIIAVRQGTRIEELESDLAVQSEELTRLRAEYKVLFERSSCEMSSLERELASVKEALEHKRQVLTDVSAYAFKYHNGPSAIHMREIVKLCGRAAINPETKP